MWEIFLRIWFFIIVLPIILIQEGYKKFKKYLEKKGHPMDWMYFVYAALFILVLFLVILLAEGYR
jgi:NhaP-type Na+/H+ or K+/H+ antiporter